jgi:hydrogenase maturation factor HypF (carbamoyltransferase family)
VQGVGFRPFVYSLATKRGLTGRVGNDVDGVFIEIEAPPAEVDDFLVALQRDAPPLAEIERITVAAANLQGTSGFSIVDSDPAGTRNTLVSADSATCDDCLRELADPADRRFGEEMLAGVDPAVIAARFHNGVADVIVRARALLRDRTGIGTVALSGGVFQNLLLLGRTVDRLRANDFRVLTHARVPTNDGGISLGQAAVAAARDRPQPA